MAKKKSVKKEETLIENIEKEVVSFESKDIETVDELIEEITPIDMSEELEELKNEIFNEEVVKVEVKEEEEVKEGPKKEEVKEETIKNKITHTLDRMFGFVWNGMEYDN